MSGLFGELDLPDAQHARARRTDPETSHMAADYVEKSGTASKQREMCLQAVLEKPGQTAAEIGRALDLERHAPSRRLPELRAAGLIRNGEARKCMVQGRQSLTWWPQDAL